MHFTEEVRHISLCRAMFVSPLGRGLLCSSPFASVSREPSLLGSQRPARHPRLFSSPRTSKRCKAPIVCSTSLRDDQGGTLYGSELRLAAGCTRERELCMLVGVDITTRSKAGNRLFGIGDSMEELGRLAETAGMSVVGVVTQALAAPISGTYIGTGKVTEVRREMDALDCKTCIFDDELSPAQQRNLENNFGGEAKGIKVLDRTALILDIFAQHAATREGQLQVELALYQYRLPRLTRMWTHLERQSGSGGVGLRGPGETQLESDRRMINTRIVKLRKDIDSVRMHRTRQRSARRTNCGLPVVALIGYTNAGKSTVLNSLTGAKVLAADALFATLDPTTRRAQLDGLKLSPEILLTDTVGFVQNLPTQLVAAFRATLEEVTEADVLVHVVDSSLEWELLSSQIMAVENVLQQIGAEGKPTIVALNKIDILESQMAERLSAGGVRKEEDEEVASVGDLVDKVSEFTGYECVGISARTGAGCDEVGVLLEETMREVLLPVEALVPYSRGELVAAVHEQGSCEFEDFTADGTHLIARAPHSLAARLREFAVFPDEDDKLLFPDTAEGTDETEEENWAALAKGRH